MFNAQTVIDQLGGNRFVVMTGAKLFVKDDAAQTLAFKLPGAARDGINYVNVKLEENDTYTVQFSKLRGMNLAKLIAEREMVHGDELRAVFVAATGLDVSL